MSLTNEDDKQDLVETNNNIHDDIGDEQNHNLEIMPSTGVSLSNNPNHSTAAETPTAIITDSIPSVEIYNTNIEDDGVEDVTYNDTDDIDNDDLCDNCGGMTSFPTGTTMRINTDDNNTVDIPIWKENRFQFINLPRNESIHRSMGRQSTVSSMAGNSIEYDDDMNINNNNNNNNITGMNPSNGTLHDITDDTNSHHIVVNTTDLPFRMDDNKNHHDITTTASSIRSNTQYNNNNNNNNSDERSIRSESTRPDPPSSIMNEKDPADEHDDHLHLVSIPQDNDVDNHHNQNNITSQKQEQQQQHKHRHVTTAEENLAVEALASLSTNMAEMTLLESDTTMNSNAIDQTFDVTNNAKFNSDNTNNTIESIPSRYPSDWDLHRDALLAETPEVTIRKTPSLAKIENNNNIDNDTIEEIENHDNSSVSGLGYHRTSSFTRIYIPNPNTISATTTGADHLMVLPRVDEHRFYSHTGIDDGTVSQLSNGVPMNINPNVPQSIVYGYNTHHSTIPPPPPTTTNMNMGVNIRSVSSGRRKIRLRLQEEIRNTNSTKRRHLRTTSLLGTIRRSSTRMLRFGNTPTQSSLYDDTDDIDTSLPAQLYTTVDRGTVNVGWFDGTSSLDLQQHIRNSVLRKLQLLDNTITDLDDLRILDESVNPPEGIVTHKHTM
jgi:hypothetical protein